MDDKTTKPEPENKAKSLAKVETSVCGLVLHTLDDMKTVAQLILQSHLAPDSFDTAEKIFVGLQTGAEIGLKPMQALNSIVIIKGKPTLWGDAALALVKKSGLLLDFSEDVTGEGDEMIAIVKSVRVDGEGEKALKCIVESTFSVADAKTAKLWGKAGPWQTHPKRMLKYKARAFNLRDNFPDVLFGMHLTEEMYGEEPLPAPESDVPPRDERRMAVPSTAVDTTRAPVEEHIGPTGTVYGEGKIGTETEAEVKQPDPNAEERAKEANEPQGELLPEPADGRCETIEDYRQCWLIHPKDDTDCENCVQVKECRELRSKESVAEEKPEPEPANDEDKKTEDVKELYIEVNGMYIAQDGKDFFGFVAYVLCLDENEVSPSKLNIEQLRQLKAYIETSGVAIT